MKPVRHALSVSGIPVNEFAMKARPIYRARLFFREPSYSWKSPQDDLAAAEKLINDCDYYLRDEELADAKQAILGQESR
jgi:hypothetical protein